MAIQPQASRETIPTRLMRFDDHVMTSATAGKKSGPTETGKPLILLTSTGAGEAIRTPDPHLGKVMLYP